MTPPLVIRALCPLICVAACAPLQFAQAQTPGPRTPVEQRRIEIRDPATLPAARLPDIGPPNTVADRDDRLQAIELTLDDAIRIALQNAEVIRVLGGVTASTSGRTVYDTAIANTDIDRQNSIFDPIISADTTWGSDKRGFAVLDPIIPGSSILQHTQSDAINTTLGISKRMYSGAEVGLNGIWSQSRFAPGVFPLDPEGRSTVQLSLRQPLMRNYGWRVNQVPIVVSRIDTERSYFQFKDATQEYVRGVITAYWSLVAARVDVWARQQQVQQSEFAVERATARQEEGLSRAADVAQARSALANFRANLIAARSNQILAESALRNILKLEPSGDAALVPTSPPAINRIPFDWELLLATGEKYRPDIVELKLILDADRQLWLQADNQARPQLDAVVDYQWDGLRGEMPNGGILESGPGQFTGFNVGVNFSVPLGLRQSRAALRRQELICARDRANLDQGIHQMVHQLAVTYRNLDQFYEQIGAFKEAREAALMNYENQVAEFVAGRQNFLNVLQAITDWGNAVSQEARSVTQYNSELAAIERQTGTILETHGIVFYEERYGSIGPLGRIFTKPCYPRALRPDGEQDRYSDLGKPAESSFELNDIERLRENLRDRDEPPAPLNPDRQPSESLVPPRDPPDAPASPPEEPAPQPAYRPLDHADQFLFRTAEMPLDSEGR